MRRLVSRDTLDSFQLLASPIWVFDVWSHSMWWGNDAALRFWEAETLQDLIAIDFSSDSQIVRTRLKELANLSDGKERITDSWTLYPKDKPKHVQVVIEPVGILQDRPGILVEAVGIYQAPSDAELLRLAEAAKTISTGLSTFTERGELISQNPAAAKIYGRSTQRRSNDNSDLQDRLKDDSVFREILNVIKSNRTFSRELELATTEGKRTHKLSASRSRDPITGELVIVLSEEDVTSLSETRQELHRLNSELDRKVTEKSVSLQDSEERFRSVFQHSPVEVGIKDIEGRFTYVNQVLASNFGVQADGLIGLKSSDFLPSKIVEQINELEARVVASGLAQTTEVERTIQGGRRCFHVTKFPIRNFTDEVIGIGGVSIDVTETREAQRALSDTEELMSQAIDALPVGIAIFDSYGRLELFNKQFKRLLPRTAKIVEKGVLFETLIRNSTTSVASKLGFKDEETYIAARLKSSRQSGSKWTYKQSTGKWITTVEHPTSNGGFVSIITDITDYKVQQEQLNHVERVRAMGELTGGVAHDFNNILAVIQGNAELLTFESEQVDNGLTDQIIEAVRRGAGLTQQLLAFARKQVLRPEPVNIQEVLPDLVDMLKHTLGQSILVVLDVSQDTWLAAVDRTQLESALLNLALNSRDAMPNGGTLSFSSANKVIRSDAEKELYELELGEYVEITVSDTGLGIPAEHMKRALEPFFTTKEPGEGSGLGLSMVYGFVKQSGGSIHLNSNRQKGTVVSIYLPRSHAERPDLMSDKTVDYPMGNGEKILVIEDDPQVLQLGLRILERLGYTVTGASDLVQALSHLEQSPDTDLVLSDIILPGGKTGVEFSREFKTSNPHVRFIFMSGYVNRDRNIPDLMSEEVPIGKPFDIAQVADAVHRALGKVH